ncbi:MAG: restriction endonuclease [Spiribacter salinus]|uniref:Restriction endonuclease n=1 Tax=Spiribacter salinus TaxID=1335746 RepID=A0A540VSE4_9GAMM|nr:MAG: restriction endonuclease [Spiribacter salinus]
MTETKLQSAQALREACENAEKRLKAEPGGSQWVADIAKFIDWFQNASDEERTSEEFQRKLWDENPVSAIGQGSIDISTVIDDPEFRRWSAHALSVTFEQDAISRRKHIEVAVKRLRSEFQSRLPRIPQLKMFRALAIAFPHDFSTVADGRRVKAIYREIFGGRAKRPVPCHFAIMDRLTEVLGAPSGNSSDLAVRMAIPWGLYEQFVLSPDEEATEEIVSPGGDTRLIPMPAARRRRGLTVIANGLQTILGALDFIEDGVGKDELIAHLRTLLPNYKDSSLNVTIGVLTSELGLVKRDNDLLVLTDRGQALLETQDPSELADWLLTRVLGLDMALVTLRDEGPQAKSALLATIKRCNPGLTTNFAPSAMLSWLKSFGVVEDSEGLLVLTDVGQQWAERIHWNPPVLEKEPALGDSPIEPVPDVPSSASIKLPEIEGIISAIQSKGHFDAHILSDLHAGLWSDDQRHFAVLTGLSGTGKTLLAREYGAALRPDGGGVYHLSVQPGWYDAGAVLGYVNPLRPDAYVRTGFLEFLMKAVDRPELPFIAILDEMNLSHPEQYLAPILSSMESAGGTIDLHQEGDDFDGVPRKLAYPRNLVLMGTVNMDETTHGLSDKLLDRAFTVEFWDVDVDAFPGWRKTDLNSMTLDRTHTVLKELYAALRPARLHFGWRTISDVLGFMRASRTTDDETAVVSSLDSVIYAKVLPKMRGDDSQRFRAAIDETKDVLARHGLHRSSERVEELREDLFATGTARFWR